ncbi:MAG: glycosyltransferase family 4 protein [Sporolactobacillus sp.]
MRPLISVDMRMIDSSGIGTYISNLVPLIIKRIEKAEFNLIGDRKKLEKFSSYPNVRICHCNTPIYSLREQIDLLKCIPRETVLFWSPHYNIPLFYRGAMLVTVHDVFHLAMKQYVSGLIKKLYANLMFKGVKYKASKVLTVSYFTKEELLKYVNIKGEQIAVTPNGISKKWFHLVNGTRLCQKPYILYVGNVKPHKNLSSLIKAFELIENKTECDLVIVGKKDGFITEDTRIQEITKRNEQRIHFTGFVEENVLINYVQNASLFVFPSLYEGFGLPPLEAMASGIPVAVSDIPPLHEVCGNAAAYFNPFDEKNIAETVLNELALGTNSAKRKLLINQAENFQWEKCAEETSKVITDLLT